MVKIVGNTIFVISTQRLLLTGAIFETNFAKFIL